MSLKDKAIVTCALTGVLTDPKTHPVPVTPAEMAAAAREAYDAGASVVHCHFRRQEPGMGKFPTWDVGVVTAVCDAIRAEVPDLVLNLSTGVVGPDISGPAACLRAVRPEMAALNAGSLNYLKTRADGSWAWPPMLFDNSVEKIKQFLEVMDECGVVPECECFDTGIARSVRMFVENGMLRRPAHASLVMGVDSGMPAKAEWLPLIVAELDADVEWQVIAIGREDIWPLHRKAAELGGNLRTGVEDTFYLPDGSKTASNGQLVEALVRALRETGREPCTPAETRARLAHAPA